MTDDTFRLALAAVRNYPAFADRLAAVERAIAAAGHGPGGAGAALVCFPEAYLPGLRGFEFPVAPVDQARQEAALATVQAAARAHEVAVVLGMEWEVAGHDRPLNIAMVVAATGEVLGYQAKNQIAPPEAPFYVADGQRRVFTIVGVPIGIAICHEGWRYPETVRWAARQGAKIVVHPQLTGSDDATLVPYVSTSWGDPAAAYYEKAMLGRAVENEVFFASVNNAFAYPESATCIVDPAGRLAGQVPYGEEGLLVRDLDLSLATGRYAHRYRPELYPASAN